MHRGIGQQLGEVHLLVQGLGLQLVAGLGGALVATFLDDQAAQLFLAAQGQFLVVETGDQGGEQIVHGHQHTAGGFDLALEYALEVLQHGALHGGGVQAGVQRRPGRGKPREVGVAARMVFVRRFGAQGIAPLAALGFREAGLL